MSDLSGARTDPGQGGRKLSGFTLGHLAEGDLGFLHAMLREAVCWSEPAPSRTIEDIVFEPALGKYVQDWGRPGDAGVLAVSDAGERLGAAWYRLFDAADHGFGFVSADIPELGIATIPRCRGLGVGTALLRDLVHVARSEGRAGLSLSVDDGNARASRLYERLGFHPVERVGDGWTMLLELSPSGIDVRVN